MSSPSVSIADHVATAIKNERLRHMQQLHTLSELRYACDAYFDEAGFPKTQKWLVTNIDSMCAKIDAENQLHLENMKSLTK